MADIEKIRRRLSKIPKGSILRLGGMTDCFQPCEEHYQVTYETIRELNLRRIRYLIVTKSDLVATPKYLQILDRELAHIQITVTTLNDTLAWTYEKAASPSDRIRAILTLQELDFDVAIRLSPLIPEFLDFDLLAQLPVQKGIVEFLRVNAWIKRWLKGVDFSAYTYHQGGYLHLPLEKKVELIEQISISTLSVCEDVTEHYQYWMENVNPKKEDCCNLKTKE